ncbi:MAG: PKD domain-containing protein [Bacteroidales bacterium]|nr:PKD domain-containing protein [Bacteroidales bacterium]
MHRCCRICNSSAGNTNCFWDFGDGTFSYEPSGTHNYSNAGNFKVKLIAAPGDACADTISWNITVEKAISNFTLTPESSCNPSTSVALASQTYTNLTSYKWTFHDNSTSTEQSLIKNFTQVKDKDPFEIHEASGYPVKLTVTSQNGCKDSVTKYFTVQQPTALFRLRLLQDVHLSMLLLPAKVNRGIPLTIKNGFWVKVLPN